MSAWREMLEIEGLKSNQGAILKVQYIRSDNKIKRVAKFYNAL